MCHIYHRAIGRVKVSDPVGTMPNELSLYEPWKGFDFSDSNETAKSIKTVGAEEHAKGVIARALPYAVTGTTRDSRRWSGRTTAFDQYTASHIGGHALEGGDHRMRRWRARYDFDLIEPGAF